jgi:SAM-dependent methyltransferase
MLRNFAEYAAKNFGNPAGIGGKIAAKIMNIMNQRQYNIVLRNIKLEPDNHILDIGFGNGYLIKKLIGQNIPIKIYGIEISSDMLHKVELENLRNIQNGILALYLESINKTSFGNSFFDKIYTVNTMYFWDEPAQCFSEIKRILKPDGIFMNVLYTKEYLNRTFFTKYGFAKYTVAEIENITRTNGMNVIETIEIKKNKSYCIISAGTKSTTSP